VFSFWPCVKKTKQNKTKVGKTEVSHATLSLASVVKFYSPIPPRAPLHSFSTSPLLVHLAAPCDALFLWRCARRRDTEEQEATPSSP
jgi:hypothetical protein